MAASAADIRSALSLPEGNASAGPSQSKKPVGQHARKPEGISRELYSLIGPSVPPYANLVKPRLKQKPNLGGGGKTRWELQPFKPSAREDGLELHHWVKVTLDGPQVETEFSQYDVRPPVLRYSQDEYTRLLEDKNWTKEETDYLFNVVRDYDCRWYIIHDRYDYPGGPSRVLDDLKERYYSVSRKLIRSRPFAGDESSKAHMLASYQFDKERELTRKKYLLSLENRTPEQIAEEEALYIEVKRLEQNERKFKRDRDNLLRTLAGMDSGLPDIVEDDGASLGIITDGKKKKKGGPMDMDSPSTPSTVSTPAVKRPHSTKNAAQDAQHCIIRTDIPTTAMATKAAHQPAYLRSFKLPIPKAAIGPKVSQALAELGISHSRLVMPTKENTSLLEALLDATAHLVETKRAMDKVEYDIQVLKSQLEMRGKSQSADGMAGAGEAMDDDGQGEGEGEAETEGEDGRARSVVSSRSVGRSRKHSRRSMSISSVDTTATASTRAGNKRQKRS